MATKTNFEITFVCKELGLEENCKCYSPEIEKIIKSKRKKEEKVTLTDCESDIILTIFDLWDSERLILPRKGRIEALAKFIHDTFNIPKKRGRKGYLSLETIKSELYKLRG